MKIIYQVFIVDLSGEILIGSYPTIAHAQAITERLRKSGTYADIKAITPRAWLNSIELDDLQLLN